MQLIIIFRGDFPEGRVENARLKAFALGLKSYGWEISFLPLYPTSYAGSQYNKETAHWEGLEIIRLSQRLQHYKINKVARFAQILAAQLRLIRWIIQNRNKESVLFFYTPQWIDSLLGVVVAGLTSNEVVVDQTDLHSLRGNKVLHKSEEWIAARLSSKLFVISDFLFQHFKNKISSEKLRLLPIVVDFDRFSDTVPAVKDTIGYVGSFGPKDGIDFLLKNIALVKTQNPKIKLRLIGKINQKKELETRIVDLEIERNVDLLDEVEYEEIPHLLCGCEMLIMNRDGSSFSKSGFPTKLGEYFATKRPVLMGDIGAYTSLFEDKKEVVKYRANDLQDLSDKIQWVMQHPTESKEIGLRGYETAKERYSKEVVGGKLNQYLLEIH